MKKFSIIVVVLFSTIQLTAQQNSLDKLQFVIGDWSGTGTGFGSNTSVITASYNYVMNKKYIEVIHESKFEPTEKNPKGDHHIDNGFISYDVIRKTIVYRQFNNEGFVNQYILNEELSNDTQLIFESEAIENFMPGGKARFTIKKISETELETIFDVSFPNKEFSCFGTNKLVKE